MISNFSMSQALKHAALIVGALIVILPFYAMLSYSFKSPHEIETNTGGFFGAQEPMVDEWCVKANNPSGVLPSEELKQSCTTIPVVFNYESAFSKAPLVRYLFNGVFVTASIFLIQVLVALPCAYALAKLKFWGRDAVFMLVLFCLLIPVHAIALPLYIMLSKVGLINSYAALIIPWTA